MPEDEQSCERCGRTLVPARRHYLYGETEGIVVWSGGPYGYDCAGEVALDRWRRGLMTYREYTAAGPGRPYKFHVEAFGEAHRK